VPPRALQELPRAKEVNAQDEPTAGSSSSCCDPSNSRARAKSAALGEGEVAFASLAPLDSPAAARYRLAAVAALSFSQAALLLPLLLTVCTAGPGLLIVGRLRWGPMEKLCCAVAASGIVVYLASFALFVFDAPFS